VLASTAARVRSPRRVDVVAAREGLTLDVASDALGVAASASGSVFVVAGGSKLAAGAAWPAQARELGAPAWAIARGAVDRARVGALLITQVGSSSDGARSRSCARVFTGLIAVRLREGRHPPCACFGAWSAKPLGAGHLVRNLGLVGGSGWSRSPCRSGDQEVGSGRGEDEREHARLVRHAS
jgi:hypothetical protein